VLNAMSNFWFDLLADRANHLTTSAETCSARRGRAGARPRRGAMKLAPVAAEAVVRGI